MADGAEEVMIEIAEHLRAEVRQLETLRQHYIAQVHTFEARLREIFKLGHGVDISQPGWMLDAEGGRLKHIPNSPPSADALGERGEGLEPE